MPVLHDESIRSDRDEKEKVTKMICQLKVAEVTCPGVGGRVGVNVNLAVCFNWSSETHRYYLNHATINQLYLRMEYSCLNGIINGCV